MNQIQDVCAMYPLWNTYSMDESGLFDRFCPKTSYLSSSEDRRDVRGTELHIKKDRITLLRLLMPMVRKSFQYGTLDMQPTQDIFETQCMLADVVIQ